MACSWEADPFGKLALGQATRDARSDQSTRQLLDASRFDQRRVAQGVVLRQLALEVVERSSERVELKCAHPGLKALGERGEVQLADHVAYLASATASDLVLPLVFDHRPTFVLNTTC